jgi:hypothetical protein
MAFQKVEGWKGRKKAGRNFPEFREWSDHSPEVSNFNGYGFAGVG